MKTHGDAGWEPYPSYLRRRRAARARDPRPPAAEDHVLHRRPGRRDPRESRARCARSPTAGHEIGNHSFHHEPWLHLYSPSRDRRRARAAPRTPSRPPPARARAASAAPASASRNDVLAVLQRRGYDYDASTFPTYLGPLARAYYFLTAKLTRGGARQAQAAVRQAVGGPPAAEALRLAARRRARCSKSRSRRCRWSRCRSI